MMTLLAIKNGIDIKAAAIVSGVIQILSRRTMLVSEDDEMGD